MPVKKIKNPRPRQAPASTQRGEKRGGQKSKIKTRKITRGPVAGFPPASARSSLNLPSQGSNELRAVGSLSTRATPRLRSSRLPLRTKNLKADVYDIKGKVVEVIGLPKEIFGAKINKQLLAQAVRVYLANQRKGTASTKTRGEVAGSTRKIYRQKGTGRARHGSIRAPIFVKGGVVFGPKPRDYSLKLAKKMKKAALFSAMSSKFKSGEIKILKGLGNLEPKTKIMANALRNLELGGKKILLILPLAEEMENAIRSARNIKNLNLIRANTLNTFDILNNKMLLFTKEAIEEVKKTFIEKESI